MNTCEIAEEVKDFLNEQDSSVWSDYTVGLSPEDFVEAENALDPIMAFESPRKGLYIIPVMSNYSREMSQGRQQIVKLNKSPVIVVCLSVPFLGLDTNGMDVGTWDNIKSLLNLREEIDELVAKHEWPISIRNITVEQAQELPLKQRWFLSITEFEFDSFIC